MSKRHIAIIVGFTAVIVLILIGLPYAFTFLEVPQTPSTATSTQATDNIALLNSNMQSFQQSTSNLSQETQNSYLDTVNKGLADPTISTSTRELLLLRKALIMSFVLGSDSQGNYMQQADAIFKGFIDSTGTTPTDVYVRDYSLQAMTEMYIECCYSIYLSKGSTVIGNIYNGYITKGYRPEVAKYLTLHDLTKLISKPRQADQTVVSWNILIETNLLLFYGQDLGKDMYAQLVKELSTNVAAYPNAKQILVKTEQQQMEPYLQYVSGLDTLQSLSLKQTRATDAKIDKSYDQALKMLASVDVAGGQVVAHELTAFFIPRYLYSMQRRYGSNIDVTKFNSLIEQDIEAINYSKETVGFFKPIYLEEGNRWYAGSAAPAVEPDSALYSPFYYRYFVGLAKNHANIADYLASIGVKQK